MYYSVDGKEFKVSNQSRPLASRRHLLYGEEE